MLTLLYVDCSYPLDDDASLESLRGRIFSLTGVPPADQLLLADGVGLLTHDAQLPPLLSQPACSLALMRLSERADAGALEPARARAPLDEACSRAAWPFSEVLQPRWLAGSAGAVCRACALACFAPGAAAPVAGGGPFQCACAGRGAGACLFEARVGQDMLEEGDPEGAAQLEALAAAAAAAALGGGGGEAGRALCVRLAAMAEGALAHQQPAAQAAALAAMPVATLTARAAAAGAAALEGARVGAGASSVAPSAPPPAGSPSDSFRGRLLRALLDWFKGEFFTWMNSPACGACGDAAHMRASRVEGPRSAEERAGGAARVEVYACASCRAETRFPRLNDPTALLRSRTGRCGEWANAFGLCAAALGFELRSITDWSDHVWLEVRHPHAGARQRWLHCDPCEAALDTPLLYEKGWGKALALIVATGPHEMVEVTRRYTRQWSTPQGGGAPREGRAPVPEGFLAAAIAAASTAQRARVWAHGGGGSVGGGGGGAFRISRGRAALLDERAAEEAAELAATLRSGPQEAPAEEAAAEAARRETEERGRTTGSLECEWEWRWGWRGGERRARTASPTCPHPPPLTRRARCQGRAGPRGHRSRKREGRRSAVRGCCRSRYRAPASIRDCGDRDCAHATPCAPHA